MAVKLEIPVHYMLALGGLLVLLTVTASAATNTTDGTCVEVIDGDTVVIEIEGDLMTVNLADVDAPELDQPYGKEAQDFISGFLLDQPVNLRWVDDGHAATVRVGEVNVAHELANAGLAWAGETDNENLVVAVVVARGNKRGLWQDDNPVPPSTWRNRQPPPTPAPTPADVARNLADAGRRVELKKNADGKTVIAGLPMVKFDPEGEEIEEPTTGPAGGLRANFGCPAANVAGCVQGEFASRFSEAYPDDSAGTFTAKEMNQGEGSLTIMFQGVSTMNRGYAVGTACHCPTDAEECQCVMQFGPLAAATDESDLN